MKGRSVVVCDQCGKQAEMVRNSYMALVAPDEWSGGRYMSDKPVRKGADPAIEVDFCSAGCRIEYGQTHTRDQRIRS